LLLGIKKNKKMAENFYANQVLKSLSEQNQENKSEETQVEEIAKTVETPVTEVVAEEKETTTEVEVNSLFDKLKQVEEPKQTEENPAALSEDVQKKLQEYEQYRSQVEQYENNPFIKALSLGKDLKEIAHKIVGNDVSKM